MIEVVHVLLVAMVLSGAVVVVVGCLQFVLAGLHVLRLPYARAAELYPRVAVVMPAWNEGKVLGRTIDTLLDMRYPVENVRIYVVDDASTDDTPQIVASRAARNPGVVVGLRRKHGGEGKAAAINHGLKRIRRDDWYEAVLIIDADVLVSRTALRRMTRHFGDRQVGGVTAYIKEGTEHPNYVNRFVAFEYITAQAAARRAQNTIGAQACLAGGAQLIRREALEHLGGEIDTTTLAEDSVTTFRIQLAGYDVHFDGNAVVWAEEPSTIVALWRQRVRWARGNAQVTRRFRGVWLHRMRAGALGGPTFAAIWASVVFMPVFMFVATVGLLVLFVIDRPLGFDAFRGLWALTGCAFVFITCSSLLIDPEAGRRCWREGLLFPGAINLALIAFGLFGPFVAAGFPAQVDSLGLHGGAPLSTGLLLFADIWLSASILTAYLLKRLDDTGRVAWLVHPLLYVVGYGPLLCAMTVGGYVAELRGAERRWEKTEKVGGMGELAA
jgi:cellulose synthase/poly-beta-1,6-N-acetylglucosamine synthase-like glycosyltransferase